jgi:hypothetical protein
MLNSIALPYAWPIVRLPYALPIMLVRDCQLQIVIVYHKLIISPHYKSGIRLFVVILTVATPSINVCIARTSLQYNQWCFLAISLFVLTWWVFLLVNFSWWLLTFLGWICSFNFDLDMLDLLFEVLNMLPASLWVIRPWRGKGML